MKNAVGREILDELLKEGWKVYQGAGHRDGELLKKRGPRTRIGEKPQGSKLVGSLREAIQRCGLRDGMTISFHHHFRDGDYVANLVMKEVAELGIRDVTIAASSLGAAQIGRAHV